MLIMDIDKERQMLRFEHGQRGYESRDIKNQPTILVCECRINWQPTFCVLPVSKKENLHWNT
jgi:hypothetical protein